MTILLLILSVSTSANQSKLLFTDADCTIIYSLKHSANTDFTDDIDKLHSQIQQQNVKLIDLNHWQKTPIHLEVSGRQRNKIRSTFNLPKDSNQAVIFNNKGQLISRLTGSVSLVNALFDCQP